VQRSFAVTLLPHPRAGLLLFLGLLLSAPLASRVLAARSRNSRNIRQVGYCRLPGYGADLWVHRGFAYVGSWAGGVHGFPPAVAGGVRIVDLARPAHPRLIGTLANWPGTTQEDVEVARVWAPAFQGDLLAVGIQHDARTHDAVAVGADLWDVTDPRRPKHLAFWQDPVGLGFHELHLLKRGNRLFLLGTVLHSEERDPAAGDLRILEITDPYRPVQIADWGLVKDGGFPPPGSASPGAEHVGDAERFAHSVSTSSTGKLAAVSCWDAGAVLLDISKISEPRMLGRTVYPAGEGATHSAIFTRKDRLLVTTDEITYFDDERRAVGAGFARFWSIADRSDPRQLAGFATGDALDPPTSRARTWYTVHNPFVVGDTAYFSWYSDGVRVVDLSDVARPRERAWFVPRDAFVWGVHASQDLIFISDLRNGLYVLRETGQ
jgi:hypothetical protein